MFEIKLKMIHKGQINDALTLIHLMAWHQTGDDQISEPMMA